MKNDLLTINVAGMIHKKVTIGILIGSNILSKCDIMVFSEKVGYVMTEIHAQHLQCS
jgi:hypothetical protein